MTTPHYHTKQPRSEPILAHNEPLERPRRKVRSAFAADLKYDPRMLFELVLNLPRSAQIGVGSDLRPLLELAIADLRNTETQIGDEKLIDNFLSRVDLNCILNQKWTYSLFQSVCHSLIGSFLSGYNTALLNTPAVLILNQCHIDINAFSSLQTFYCLGGLFGALCAGYFADRYGRKVTLLFANCIFMASGILAFAFSLHLFGDLCDCFSYFLISRLLSGLASGISTAIIPAYLGEISPPMIRGEVGTLNAFVNAFGILFAVIIGFDRVLGTDSLWPWLFAVNVVPFIVQSVLVSSFTPSPQWLLIRNDIQRARSTLQWLRETDEVELDIQSIMTKEMLNAMSNQCKEKDSKDSNAQNGPNSEQNYLAQGRMLLVYIFTVTVALQILQQLSGINSVWYYSSLILQNAGLKSSVQLWSGNVLIASTNFLGVMIPVRLVERLGRKWLIYLSCSGMICASIMLSAILVFQEDIGYLSGYISVALLICYVISFAMGLGPIVGLLTVELCPSSYRGKVASVAFFVNYVANLFVAQYANTNVSYAYYFLFVGVCLVGIIFTKLAIVETKGKAESEIQNELLDKVSRSKKTAMTGNCVKLANTTIS